jgi:hypothetical protein
VLPDGFVVRARFSADEEDVQKSRHKVLDENGRQQVAAEGFPHLFHVEQLWKSRKVWKSAANGK